MNARICAPESCRRLPDGRDVDPLSGGLNGDFLASKAFHLYLQKTIATDGEIFA
jgi:hypothetical protein